ncbi:MAG: hypothetical protein J1D99_05495 [Campylobacter sp.]|nr:hypothetical protein [Campylobacter sp.]
MTYENENLEQIEKQINTLQSLLDEAKEKLSSSKIQEALSSNFEALKKALEESLKSTFQSEENKLKENMQSINQNSLKELYEQNKEEFYRTLSAKVDFSLLFDENKDKLEFFNQKALKEALEKEFSKERYTAILENYKKQANTDLKDFEKDLEELLKSLNLCEISENLLKKVFKEQLKNLEKSEFEKQKDALAKNLLEYFLNDLRAKELLKQSLESVIKSDFSQRNTKDMIEASLLNMNKTLLEQILATKKLTNYEFKQDLVLTSMSLKIELSIINENLGILNDLKAKELRNKLLSEGSDLEKKDAVQQRVFKVV